jgi:hypothetical protein
MGERGDVFIFQCHDHVLANGFADKDDVESRPESG